MADGPRVIVDARASFDGRPSVWAASVPVVVSNKPRDEPKPTIVSLTFDDRLESGTCQAR